MKAFLDFIVQIVDPYSDTFQTESGMELYGDKRFHVERLANRIGKVVSVPLEHETIIKEGYEVVVDPTILYEQNYHLTHGTQESIFLVDKKRSYYKVNFSMVVLYRENPEAEWKGYFNNALYEKVTAPEEPQVESLLIIMPTSTKKYEEGKARLVYGNAEILEEIEPGDIVFVEEQYGVPFLLNGKQYIWYKNEDVLAVECLT